MHRTFLHEHGRQVRASCVVAFGVPRLQQRAHLLRTKRRCCSTPHGKAKKQRKAKKQKSKEKQEKQKSKEKQKSEKSKKAKKSKGSKKAKKQRKARKAKKGIEAKKQRSTAGGNRVSRKKSKKTSLNKKKNP